VQRSVRRSGAAVAAAFGAALCTRAAFAHEPFSVTTEARALHDALTLHVTMAGRTATLACPGAAGEPHRLTPEDVARFRGPLERCARGLYVVTSAGRRLESRAATVSLSAEGDFEARIIYPPAAPGPLSIEAVHLSRLPDAMYGAELTVTGERVFLGQALLRASAPSLGVRVPAAGATASKAVATLPSFGRSVLLGVEHLHGYEHLAFLVGLCAVSRKLTGVLAVMTAFMVAHGIALAGSALGAFVLPARIVEPLIALTIVLVAAENLWHPNDSRGRAVLAVAFGLVHGFGFAGSLASLGLVPSEAPLGWPLLGFDLGIGFGQVAAAALLVPVFLRLRRLPAIERHGPPAISLGVGAVGVFWALTR